MNTIIELHDSTLAEIAERSGTVIVHFKPAYLHKSKGRPGYDPGTGWSQDVRLTFTDASISGVPPELPALIVNGELTIDGKPFENHLPVPLDVSGSVQLRLVFARLPFVTIVGKSVKLKPLGKAIFVEDFTP